MQNEIPQSKILQLFLSYKPGWPRYLWILSIYKMSKSTSAPVAATCMVTIGHGHQQTRSPMDTVTKGRHTVTNRTYTVMNVHGHEGTRVYVQLL